MDELSLDQLADAIEQVADSKSDNFIEMAGMLGLDPLTDFAGADLSGADLRKADLSGALLRCADLSGADLSGADLSGADLRKANLRDADLREALLREATLWEADLSGALLREATLSGADLSGARIDRTIFGSNIGLSEQQEDDLKERGAIFIDVPGSGDRVDNSPRVPSRR